MRVRLLAASLLTITIAGAGAPGAAAAQQTPALSPPAACTKAANDWQTAQIQPAREAYLKATDSTRASLLQKYRTANSAAVIGAQKMASDCAARFSVTTIPPNQLMDLISLYSFARDTTNSRLATERLLTEKNLPPRAQGMAWTLGINQEISKNSSFFGILDGAEAYMTKIDGLPDSLSDVKLAAHRRLLGQYDYLDVAEGLRSHAIAVIALAKKLNRPADQTFGYSLLARSFADRLMPDSALRILDGAEKEIGAPATAAFKDFRERYALIGTPAAEIAASWWINTDAKTVTAPAKGKVTLIEFTAHWCGPCKNSYPGLRALSARFKGKPFEGVMVTQLYGYLGTQRNLTPEQEIAADREYFGKEHALAFPVAINPQIKPGPDGKYVFPKPDTDYKVSGIPQIMLIDKRGVIRQIVTGWDQGNTERFGKFINQLLDEHVNTPNP